MDGEVLQERQAQRASSGWRKFKRCLLMLWLRIESWQERARQRRALLALDERLLKDIGLTRADAVREGRKPFWKS